MMTRKSKNLPVSKDVDIVTIEDQVHCSGSMNNSIIFDYQLDEKAAKAKLVKCAKKIPLEIQEIVLVPGRLLFFLL